MTNQSDTPRTDAEIRIVMDKFGTPQSVVYATFARQLERELAASRDEVERVTKHRDEILKQMGHQCLTDVGLNAVEKLDAEVERLTKELADGPYSHCTKLQQGTCQMFVDNERLTGERDQALAAMNADTADVVLALSVSENKLNTLTAALTELCDAVDVFSETYRNVSIPDFAHFLKHKSAKAREAMGK